MCRFNKKAHERKKGKLALQLLKHKKAGMIQRCFRTHRFLAVFNQKAHARKLRWMAEAEARALEEYKAACFLQDCYMRSKGRAQMTLRFADRGNMMKQAEVSTPNDSDSRGTQSNHRYARRSFASSLRPP